MTLATRRDAILLGWLRAYPDLTADEAAADLAWSVRSTHRRLRRLERDGRVEAVTAYGDVFNYTVYRTLEGP